MNSVHRRHSPGSGSQGSDVTMLRDSEDQSDTSEENRFASSRDDFSVLDDTESRSEYDDDEYFHRPRRADNYYGIRQEYLRSYTFTRDVPTPEKKGFKRFKAIVWAVLCCKYKSSQARSLRDSLASRSGRFISGGTDYLSTSCRKIAVPSCIRLSTLKVA